jgi:hypothetical protein
VPNSVQPIAAGVAALALVANLIEVLSKKNVITVQDSLGVIQGALDKTKGATPEDTALIRDAIRQTFPTVSGI